MATRLRWRLQRLDAMRAASTRLMGRERLDRDVFGRGDPEPVNVIKLRTYKDTLYDLLTAYATDRVRKLGGKSLSPADGAGAADRRGARTAGADAGPDFGLERPDAAVAASNGRAGRGGVRRWPRTLLACLELARDGKVEIQQMAPFAEIFVRDRERRQPRRP